MTAFAWGVAAQYGDLGNREIRPGTRRMADDFGIGKDTARRYLTDAVDAGILVMTRAPRKRRDGVWEQAHYQINLEWGDVFAMAEMAREDLRHQ